MCRILAFSLTLALAQPAPAFAMRQPSPAEADGRTLSGLEESLWTDQLRPGSGIRLLQELRYGAQGSRPALIHHPSSMRHPAAAGAEEMVNAKTSRDLYDKVDRVLNGTDPVWEYFDSKTFRALGRFFVDSQYRIRASKQASFEIPRAKYLLS